MICDLNRWAKVSLYKSDLNLFFLGSGIRLFDGINKEKCDNQSEEVIPSSLNISY